MMGRPVVIGALLFVAALSFSSCTGAQYEGDCGRPEGCFSGSTFNGISCLAGVCSCLESGLIACCPNGGSDCAPELLTCRPKAECSATAVKDECTMDDDCAGPPDARCGVPRCDAGKCEVEIWAAEAIPNQFPGDCKVNVCSAQGEVEVWMDPSDLPLDANPCTMDLCYGDMPQNPLLPDKSPCPGLDKGVCDDGKCWECSWLLDVDCSDGMHCDYDMCVPYSCMNGKIDGEETDLDCGGSICDPCGITQYCIKGSDCIHGVCGPVDCLAPTHTDGVKNGDETGIDCGYPGGPLNSCNDGEGCKTSADCKSFVCYLGVCQEPTCLDTVKNGDETGVDCGGGCSLCQD